MKKITKLFTKQDELDLSIEEAKKDDASKAKTHANRSRYINPCKLKNGGMINPEKVAFYLPRAEYCPV